MHAMRPPPHFYDKVYAYGSYLITNRELYLCINSTTACCFLLTVHTYFNSKNTGFWFVYCLLILIEPTKDTEVMIFISLPA